MTRRTLAASLVVALFAAATPAAAPKAEYDPAALARTVAPFLDEQTLLVGHADLTRVDVAAAFGKLFALAGEMPEDLAGELKGARDLAAKFVADMTAAGATDVFLVVSLADVPEEPLLLVVPLGKGADERAIRGLLYSGRPDGPTSRPANSSRRGRPRTQVNVHRRAVVRCNWPVWQRVREMTPHRRPELARAFAAAGDSAAQLLVLPTADNRRVIEEMLPELPEEIGGGPSTALTQGLLWAAVGVNAPPGMHVNAVVQSRDAAAAKALKGIIGRGLALLAAERELRDLLPGDVIERLRAALAPEVTGDRLTWRYSAARIDDLVTAPLRHAIKAFAPPPPPSRRGEPASLR